MFITPQATGNLLVRDATTNKKVIVPKGAQPSAPWSHRLLVDGTL